jgi:protein ImuB
LELETSQREQKEFHQRTLKLPVPLLDAKIFLKLLQLDLNAHSPQKPVVKVSLVAEPVQPRRSQSGLFVRRGPEPERLQLTLARIAAVVGEGNAGSAELLDTHRPDAFRMNGFVFDAEREAASAIGRVNKNRETRTLLRRFRPPLPATVTVRDHLPVHIAFSGGSKKIIARAGPWRASGDWWTAAAWARDEWDVAFFMPILCDKAAKDGGDTGSVHLCRIFRDVASNRWFVEGSYD